MPGLQDFIQKLKEQDDSDVIYSKEPEHNIQIIPPEKTTSSITLEPPKIKVIPPNVEEEPKPVRIKFKLNILNSSEVVETNVENVEEINKPILQTPNIEQSQTTILQKPQVEQKPILEKPIQQVQNNTQQTIQQTTQEIDPVEQLFRLSGTSMTKRALWYDYYEKAQASRKKNSIVDRMKIGKFAITIDNQVLILPDHDIRNKSSSQLLGEKWLHNY